LRVIVITTATEDVRTTTLLNTKNHFSLCGGVSRNGTWIDQKRKCERSSWLVIPADGGRLFGIFRYDGQIARMHCVIAVEPVYVWIACQKSAVIIRTTTAKRAKYHPQEERMATEKGMCRSAPTAPFRANGIVVVMLPKIMQIIASRLNLN
jgi:hypothetical protein